MSDDVEAGEARRSAIARTAEPRWLRIDAARTVAGRRLLCLPHAGGTAGAFAGWADELPMDAEVVAVQYPGRQDRIREPFMTDMAVLADAVAAQVRRLPALPTTIFGHSLGSALGYEVALRLGRNAETRLTRLIVSARTTPQRRAGEPNYRLDDEGLAATMAELAGGDAKVYQTRQLWPVVLPPIRSDLALLDRHHPTGQHRVAVPIAAFGGTADPTCSPTDLAAWRELTDDDFRLRLFPGGHHYLANDAAAVCEALTELLLT